MSDIKLPRSASDFAPGARVTQAKNAYIKNPIADRPMLTPYEVVDAISMLSSILVADDRYRNSIKSREVPQ